MKWTEDRLNEITSDESRANIIRVMEKYGDNKWWESNDPEYIARYQLFEDILMVDFSVFQDGVEKLLGHPVWTHEFARRNIDKLREEARIIIYQRDVGRVTMNSYKEKKILAKSFRDAMNKTRYMDAMMMREAFEEAIADER